MRVEDLIIGVNLLLCLFEHTFIPLKALHIYIIIFDLNSFLETLHERPNFQIMRILASSHNSSTGTVTTSTQNKFEEFAFTDASDRHLKRDDMRQFKQTSQKMNKRIITSDDEDEEGVHSTSTHTKSSSGWLSARDPSNLSSNQRQLNVSVAMNERKKISVGTGSKAKTTVSYNSDDDESLLESNTPVGDKKRKLVKKLSTSRIEEAIKAPQGTLASTILQHKFIIKNYSANVINHSTPSKEAENHAR